MRVSEIRVKQIRVNQGLGVIVSLEVSPPELAQPKNGNNNSSTEMASRGFLWS